MTEMRVAVVARAVKPLHGLGGLERHVHDMVLHLARRGVQVTLIAPPPRPEALAARTLFTDAGVTMRSVPYVTFPFAGRRGTTILDRSTAYPLFGWRAGREALSLVRTGRIDLVHGLGASVLGYAIARGHARRSGATAPLVFNPQGLEEFGASAPHQAVLKRVGYAPLRSAVRACAAAADRIIATDRALEPVVIRHLQPRPGQLCTIPNAIDVEEALGLAGPEAGRAFRERHRISDDAFVIVSVGRLEANKGFEDVAAALALASRSGHALATAKWRWILVGAGPHRSRIEDALARHGITNRTTLAGRLSDADLHASYEAASLFVHATRYEGSSLVTLEAMAHRKPVVATRAGGLPDKVRAGENGWLVEPGDIEALARAIEDAARPGAPLAAFGDASYSRVTRDFSWTSVVDTQLSVYDALLETR